MAYRSYGEALRGLRQRYGLTQRVFGVAIGLTQATCSQHERTFGDPNPYWPELNNGTLKIDRTDIGWTVEGTLLLAKRLKAYDVVHKDLTAQAEEEPAPAVTEEPVESLNMSKTATLELETVNKARKSMGMPPLLVRVRRCLGCKRKFEAIELYYCSKCTGHNRGQSAAMLSGLEVT